LGDHRPFSKVRKIIYVIYEFVTWYNNEHRHDAIKYVTPAQRHAGFDKALLQHRKAVYEAAKAANPQRWAGTTRNWERTSEFWLNPPKELCANKPSLAKVA